MACTSLPAPGLPVFTWACICACLCVRPCVCVCLPLRHCSLGAVQQNSIAPFPRQANSTMFRTYLRVLPASALSGALGYVCACMCKCMCVPMCRAAFAGHSCARIHVHAYIRACLRSSIAAAVALAGTQAQQPLGGGWNAGRRCQQGVGQADTAVGKHR